MPTTPNYALRYPALSDAPNGPAAVQALAEDVENLGLRCPLAVMYQSVGQSIPNDQWTPLQFTSETIDTHGGHSTTANTSRWTCPSGWAGYYLIGGLYYPAVGVAGVRVAAVAKNGARSRGSVTRVQPCADSFGNGVTTQALVQLAAGDYVEIHALHTQGAAMGTFTGDPETSSMNVAFLRR